LSVEVEFFVCVRTVAAVWAAMPIGQKLDYFVGKKDDKRYARSC
jgi:hypothetical protein